MWQVFLDGLSVFSENWPQVLGAVGFTCLGCGPVFFLSRRLPKGGKIPGRSIGLLVTFFALSVILRLAFVSQTFVPSYFDSVEHYRIIKELVTGMETSTTLERLPSLTPGYYHLGFHLLASILTFGLRANPIDVILVLGQVILAAIPVPLFFLLRVETKSDVAAFVGALLAGFGWYMPGFAVNWGKYPALAGLLVLEIVLSMAYFISQGETHQNRYLNVGMLILGILISTFFHSRTLIVIFIAFVSWLIARKIQIWHKAIQYLLLGIFLAGTLVFGILIQKEPLLRLTLEPYLKNGVWVTLIVLALSPFALLKFPRSVYSIILFIFLIFVALFIPTGTLVPGFENQTLLDRPFVEMLLYLPLSLLGGLGLSGLLQLLKEIKVFSQKTHPYARGLMPTIILGIVGLVSLRDYNFYPSDCCNFVQYGDTVAFDWLDRNTPPDTHILIASTRMNILPSGPSAANVGTDAGIWIPVLTGRATAFAPFDTDLRSGNTLEQLCQQRIDYVYVGGTEQSFDVTQLQAEPDWYFPTLSLPNVQIYKIARCSQ